MKVLSLMVGPIMTNCYILCDEEAKVCAVIDPGDEAGRIEEEIASSGCTPTMILLTHGHFDHCTGVAGLLETWPELPVYIHQGDVTDSSGGDPFHDVRQGRERVILEPGLEHPGHFVQCFLNDLGGLAMLHQKIGEIFGKALDHFRQPLDQRRKIHHHLWDDEIGEQKDQGQQDDGRKGGG